MSTIVTRAGKGSPLTNNEVDSNFTNLNSDKYQSGDDAVFASVQLSGGTGDQGKITWNVDEETLDVILNGSTLQVGQEIHTHCRNNTGSTIPNGTVVMVTGTIGNSGRITIAPYDNTTDIKYVVGITTEDIANDTDGKVTSFGKIRELDTSSFSDGDVLYTAASGGLTATEPTSGIKSAIAFVIHSHASDGTIMVRVSSINENKSIEDLIDVNSMTPTDGQLLTWDNANSRWDAADAPVSLPDQTGNDGYFLTTDGTTASWAQISTDKSTDGGFANSVYLISQSVDGGSASG